MENIKIYDANLTEIGIMERKEAHLQAQWHITFHCWIVQKNERKILLQLRSKEKKTFPNMFDVSAAGHLMSNETVPDGIREVSEELGIDIPFSTLLPLGYRVEVEDSPNGMKNREYQSVYIALIEKQLKEFKPQAEEVAGLMWIGIDDALSLFGGKLHSAEVQGIVYNKENQSWDDITRIVTIADFIPRIQNYYLTSTIMAERAVEGKLPLSIS
jgi:isopentenyldiphosphate isomerase